MNYAIIGPQGGVNRVTDKQPQSVMEGATVVEISDEKAQQIKDGMTATPRVHFFYKNGELLTREQWREQQIAARPRPAISAERHIERQGYPAMRLVTLMDLEGKLAAAGLTAPKLVAVRGWLDTVLATFAANPEPRNDWALAPYGFEETVAEAVGTVVGAVP
jgi:hypothetical protein